MRACGRSASTTTAEQVFDFDIVHLKKGGAKEVVHVEP